MCEVRNPPRGFIASNSKVDDIDEAKSVECSAQGWEGGAHLLGGFPVSDGKVGDINRGPLGGAQHCNSGDHPQTAFTTNKELLQIIPAVDSSHLRLYKT